MSQDQGVVIEVLRALPPTPLLIVTTVAILGYLAGASLVVVQDQLGVVSNVVLGVLAAAGLAMWLRSHV